MIARPHAPVETTLFCSTPLVSMGDQCNMVAVSDTALKVTQATATLPARDMASIWQVTWSPKVGQLYPFSQYGKWTARSRHTRYGNRASMMGDTQVPAAESKRFMLVESSQMAQPIPACSHCFLTSVTSRPRDSMAPPS